MTAPVDFGLVFARKDSPSTRTSDDAPQPEHRERALGV